MIDINFDRRGTGSPLVLIHGIGSRWQVWGPILDQLAAHHDVIAVDLPGFGRSPLPFDFQPSIPAYTDRPVTFLDDLGLDRPAVAGNSMGGAIALELGRRGRASEVVAFSPAGFWNRAELVWCEAFVGTTHRLATALRPLLPAIAQRPTGRIAFAGVLFGKPTQLDPTVLVADAEAVLDAPGFFPALSSFRDYRFETKAPDQLTEIPVTIAWGDRDRLLVHRMQSNRARQLLPTAQHVTLAEAGHVPFNDDPDACARVLLTNAGSPIS